MSFSIFITRFTALTLSLACLLWSTAVAQPPAAPAGERRQNPPPPSAPREIQFPAFSERTLANGLQVVVVEHREMPVVSLRAAVKSGAAYDPKGKAGLSQLLASLLDQGTERRSAQQIQSEIDFVGGRLGASADWDAIYASAAVLRDNLDLGVELLSDILLRPSFPAAELERQRRQTLDSLIAAEQQPDYVATAIFDHALFTGSPYAAPLGGTSKTVSSVTRDEIVSHYRQHFRPNNTILIVAGDVKADEIYAKLEKAFGAWPRGDVPPATKANAPTQAATRIIVVDRPDAVQTEIRAGQVGIARNDPGYFTAVVTNYILGGGGFGSRLIEEIRVKRGLTYGVGSSFDTRLLPGKFQVQTNTKTESTIEVVKLIRAELERLRSQPVSAGELESTKTALIGQFPLSIEVPDDIASRVLTAKLYNLGDEYFKTYRQRLGAVSAEDITQFVKRVIQPDQILIVLVGNAQAFEGGLQGLGKVEKLSFKDLDLASETLRREKAPAAAAVTGAERESALTTLRAGVAALGGEAFLKQKSMKLVGTGVLSPPGMGQSFPAESVTVYSAQPQKSRMEINLGAIGSIIQASNGQVTYVSQLGQVQERPAQKPALDILREFDQPGVTVRPLPDDKVNDQATKVVEVLDAKGNRVLFHFDAQSGQLVKYQTGSDVRDSVEILLSDYRPVSGIQVAHKQVLMIGGQKFLEFTIKEAVVNTDLDPKLFEKP